MTAPPCRPRSRRRFARILAFVLALALATPAAPPWLPESVAATTARKKKRPAKKKSPPKPVTPDRIEVTLLHTTDLHGHLLPWDYTTGKPDPDVGLTKVATLVRQVRTERGGKNVLLVDAGDCIQGTPLAWLHDVGGPERAPQGDDRPDPQMACMNAMDYDAFTVGNHEYNFGLDVLARARKDAKFPWLSANTLKNGGGEAAYQSYLVREFDGVRVGILGLTTPGVPSWDDPAHWAGLTFEDPLESAKRWVPILRNMERCDAVVLVCHMGLEEDDQGRVKPGQMPNENRVLAIARTVPGVDAIVMGHTHTKVESKRVGDVLLTQAGRWGEALGRLDLVFEKQEGGGYRLSDRRARLIEVTEAVASDPAIEAIARPYHADTEKMLRTVVAQATGPFDGADARLRDNALHELIQKAQLAATGADVSLSAMFNPRAKVPAGPVTVRDAFAIYPYENTLVTLELTGADLKEALEHAARYYRPYDFGRTDGPAINPDVAGYNFDVAEGVSYTLDLSKPEGERVRGLSWRGAPLDPERRLRVAVNNYRVNGGGGYTMLKQGTPIAGPRVQAREAVIAYLEKAKDVSPVKDDNWRVTPSWIQSPAKEPLERLVRRGVVPADSAIAYDLDAPLTHRRFADWMKKLDVDDPLRPVEPKKRKSEPLDPAAALSLDRALEWTARALGTEAQQAALREPADPWRITPGGAEARVEFSGGRRLTVAEGAAVLADAIYPRLTFLHVSDFHGALLPGAVERTTQRAWGGAAVLAAHLARERAKNPNGTILTDGGDWMQGTPLSNLNFGRPVIELMNAERIDAAAIGNHEFDWSADTLRARLAEARFAALGANWMEKATGRRATNIAPWTMVTRKGLDVGILGLCTESTPQTTLPLHVRDYSFPDAGQTAAALAESVWAAGAEMLLVIGHLPGRQDSTGKVTGELSDVARAVNRELAVFGGHSHNRVLGRVDGNVPVIIPYSHGSYIGRLDVVFDRRKEKDLWKPIAEETRMALLPTYADEVRPDEKVANLLAAANKDIAPIMARVLGTASAEMGRSRARDSALGNWVADALRAAAGADFAFQNPGGLRADLAAGPITVGDVYEIMPFDNRVATVNLTGAQVLEVLEGGVSPSTCIQVSGLTFSFDPLRPRGERVFDVRRADGSPLDPKRTYRVATNDFMAQGGDGFGVFAAGQDLSLQGPLVRDVLEQDVTARATRGEKLAPDPGRRIENRGSMAIQQAAERR